MQRFQNDILSWTEELIFSYEGNDCSLFGDTTHVCNIDVFYLFCIKLLSFNLEVD